MLDFVYTVIQATYGIYSSPTYDWIDFWPVGQNITWLQVDNDL